MKQYTLTITADERMKIHTALRKALALAYDAGAGKTADLIKDAMAMSNRKPEGGFENEHERSAAVLNSWADDAASHNNN